MLNTFAALFAYIQVNAGDTTAALDELERLLNVPLRRVTFT
uniref:VapC toxin family PIN domain ribonuclease n=1 Tax=Ascaris lumbricoides TaxID=6252 RepID=A0A0M3IDY9_ASCLU